MAIRFSLHHLPLLLAPPLRSSFSSFSTYFSLHTYRPPPCLHLLRSPSHTSLSPLQFGRVVCACWIRSLSKFGHAWQRRWAPAGWTGGLFSPPDPYIKLQQGLGIPVTPLLSAPPLCCFFVYESPFLWPSISNSDWIHFWFPGLTNLVSKCPNLAKDSDSNSKTTCTGV